MFKKKRGGSCLQVPVILTTNNHKKPFTINNKRTIIKYINIYTMYTILVQCLKIQRIYYLDKGDIYLAFSKLSAECTCTVYKLI